MGGVINIRLAPELFTAEQAKAYATAVASARSDQRSGPRGANRLTRARATGPSQRAAVYMRG